MIQFRNVMKSILIGVEYREDEEIAVGPPTDRCKPKRDKAGRPPRPALFRLRHRRMPLKCPKWLVIWQAEAPPEHCGGQRRCGAR